MIKYIFLAPALILASACATDTAQNIGQSASNAAVDARDGLAEAAMSPLEDFNLRRDEIPTSLAESDNPYDIPEELGCVEIARRIGRLNGILGRDWDSADPEERLNSERLADAAAKATLGTIAAEARGLIPFRSTIRKASGAEKHEKRYQRAIQMGKERRAYLKGIGYAEGCPAPARPAVIPVEVASTNDNIIFMRETPTTYTEPELVAPAPSLPEADAEMTLSPPSDPPIESEALESVPQEWPF